MDNSSPIVSGHRRGAASPPPPSPPDGARRCRRRNSPDARVSGCGRPADAWMSRAPGSAGRFESPMQDAIKACLDCHSMCLRVATTFCLEKGGRHVEQKQLALMLNCTELCQTSANFMLSDSPLHGRVCLICAEACEACAKSCEQVGDMRECVDECKTCAKSCRAMT
jgi:hypothetical protein